ncbi:hypothetical protein [Ramlibacter albus]|uniref:Uncharacterized protein n=1 Tax=Ramlibacter albus TaxID=2079448 RepID=A0A923MAU4_9BURK|nr:hypothetical protein [Ramlibacter albus]MBC5767235.1 hypothetical protein [Ramlibacter albus]
MSSIPTSLFPILFAVLAAAAGLFFSRRPQDVPNALVSKILYAIAVGCLVIGLWTLMSSH